MPLPAPNSTWPPRDFRPVAAKYAEHSAWYAGDPDQLRDHYSTTGRARVRIDRVAQLRGGVQGAIARFWWGRPVGDLTKRQDSLHVPLASDICQASADLLFAEPPTLKVTNAKAQERLDEIAKAGVFTKFAEGAEVGAALGGNFMRVTWDRTIRPDGAFLQSIDADGAYPTFRYEQLTAVTFWWVVQTDANVVWRHLEHHELDPNGIGVIFHGLYEGTEEKLGRLRPLDDSPATAGIPVDDESKISTETPGLAVEYFPNQYPQRLLRKDPVGRNLGRSDLAGIEGTLDAIDETWASWMRDIRLAKARIIAAQHMLESAGRGQGAMLDVDQEVFVGLNKPPGQEGAEDITLNQFKIRFAEHEATINALVKVALRTAGYSGETLGEDGAGGMKTATEVVAQQTRSYSTRDRKIKLLQPRMARLLQKLLDVDNVIFSRGITVDLPTVEFPDGVQADPEALARTSQALKVAGAASTKTLVQLNHPDWDDTQVDAEVDLIGNERSLTVAMPPLPSDDDSAVDDDPAPPADTE